jgi:hypothetical protein
MDMARTIRWFLFAEAAAFATAALVHFGVLLHGYEHRQAGTAETVISAVLFAALAWTRLRARSIRAAALIAQGFALLATGVGIFTIVIGVGPRTVSDVVYHIGIVIVLAWGLTVAAPADRVTTRA